MDMSLEQFTLLINNSFKKEFVLFNTIFNPVINTNPKQFSSAFDSKLLKTFSQQNFNITKYLVSNVTKSVLKNNPKGIKFPIDINVINDSIEMIITYYE